MTDVIELLLKLSPPIVMTLAGIVIIAMSFSMKTAFTIYFKLSGNFNETILFEPN